MEKVTKVFFDPLLSRQDEVQSFLKTLPIGSAHAFNGELLLHSKDGVVTAIDISMHPEEYFSNAISLGDLGEDVLARMHCFPAIQTFNDEYSIQQAPSSTFTVPIADGQIHIFAVSVKDPSFYDLCVGDADFRTACFNSTNTFPGLTHSGDVMCNNFLLQHISISSSFPKDKAHTIFVSGYQYHELHRYKAHNPLVLVADHDRKVLYIIPVPLDTASISDAVLCCPLVIKKNAIGDLICSILPTPTTDSELMCTGSLLKTTAFITAILRANFTPEPERKKEAAPLPDTVVAPSNDSSTAKDLIRGTDLIIASHSVDLPSIRRHDGTQIIRFGKGLRWMKEGETESIKDRSSSVLPVILGDVLEGPLLLATGESPIDVPFHSVSELHQYYGRAKSIMVIVNDKMSDNARNLATPFRLNGLFIIQTGNETPEDNADISSLLDKVNINAVTALAGPQSLVLVQMGSKYFFYRGIADPAYLDTSELKYGQELTEFICRQEIELSKLSHPKWPRLVDLSLENYVFFPKLNQIMKPSQLKDAVKDHSLAEIRVLKDDILTAVPQLQALLSHPELQAFSSSLIEIVNEKVQKETGATKKEYMVSLRAFWKSGGDLELRKEKDRLLGVLRRKNKEAQGTIQWLIQALGNIVSTQISSSRTHDLKRLARQSTIKNNVAAAKAMTFDKLADMLEEHASQMGVLIVNINGKQYGEYLKKGMYLTESLAGNEMCTLDPRAIHLDGLTAGIILEQTQEYHHGPLRSALGPQQPILALGNLQRNLNDSMLAWVCWDEFVQLKNPYSIRWMEKTNDSHISAARIIMRGTLSEAVSSRSVNLTPSSPATGNLMGALLMISMQKLASTRSALSTVVPDDTTTLLMRGLFGNLLTLAGSGVKPMSFVWQLFGMEPKFEIPNSGDWIWYETAARLIPYTGWQLDRFKGNLTGLLDKLIFRMITKNEVQGAAKIHKTSAEEYCKARNIQLFHSRTIITILKTMLTEQDDCSEAAKRLLKCIPEAVEHETESYRRLHRYIVHLANGGSKRVDDNLLAASVFSKRAACFQKEKKVLSDVAKGFWYQRTDESEHGNRNDEVVDIVSQEAKDKIADAYKGILKARAELEKQWGLKPDTVKVQNLQNIKIVHDKCQAGERITRREMERLQGDAEKNRVAWLTGEEGKYGSIETLDMNFVKEILGGIDEGMSPQAPNSSESNAMMSASKVNDFESYKDLMSLGFLNKVQVAMSVRDICDMLGITPSAMEAFSAMLSASFNLKDKLPVTFKEVVLLCLKNRNRESLKPTNMLFEMHATRPAQDVIEHEKALELGV